MRTLESVIKSNVLIRPTEHSLCVSVLSSQDARTRPQFPGSKVPQAEAGLPASRRSLQGPPVPPVGPVALL